MNILKNRRNLVLIILLTAGFMGSLGQSLLTSALPSIMTDFSINATTGQWLTTIYILILGLVTCVSAFIINKYNTKRVFQTALGLFIFGCILAYISPNFYILLIARIIQATGTGMMYPLSQIVILYYFPIQDHGKAFGYMGLVVSAGPAFGPTFSGFIVDLLNWRAIFSILAVLAITLFIIGSIELKDIGEKYPVEMDFLSVIFYGLGFALIMYGVTNITNLGLTTLSLLPLIVGLIFLYIFVHKQLHADLPLLKLELFKCNIFAASTLVVCISYILMMSGTLLIPLYIQSARGMSAIISGLILLPGTILHAFMNPIAGGFQDDHGARTSSIIGFILIMIGTVPFVFFNLTSSVLIITIVYCFRMVGLSFILTPLQAYGVDPFPRSDYTHGTAILNSLRQITGALGTNILVAVVTIFSVGGAVDYIGINMSFLVQVGIMIFAFVIILKYIHNDVKRV
jgi:EmrB/QacA subfamily drug resistance transporter